MPAFFQGTADKSNIVGGTAAAAGLAHDNGGTVVRSYLPESRASMICPTDEQGRIAGIVVYIFQSHIHGMLIVVVQYDEVVTAGIERRLQELKVDRGHLRTDNGVILTHFFGKGTFTIAEECRVHFALFCFSLTFKAERRERIRMRAAPSC